MNTGVTASIILGLTAMMANAGSPGPNSHSIDSSCSLQVVKAKQGTLWTNLLEGGPIGAVVSAASHSKPYRTLVCANPKVDWAHFGHIQVESVVVAPTNLKKPLAQNQTALLKTALEKLLGKQFQETQQSGRTLKLRATIIEVRRTKRILNLVTLAVIQTPVSFGGATARFELIDSLDNVKVADVTLRSRGRVYDLLPSVTTLGDSKKVLERASKQLDKEIRVLRESTGPAEAEVASNDTRP